MVGRFADKVGALDYINKIGVADLELTSSRGQKYLPVIFPGFSWNNLMNFYGQTERAIPNQTPRQGGKFYWAQAYQWRKLGVDSFFGAMFDEVDEGTALFKTAPNRLSAPGAVYTLTLDADGFNLPSDWYLRVSKFVSSLIKGDVLPEAMPLSSYPAGSFALKSGMTLNFQMARLSFQEDGNLVLYDHQNRPVWATNTKEDCRAQICTAKFQGDGNFVFYKYNVPFWAISPTGRASKLVIGHDFPYIQIISSISGARLWAKDLGDNTISTLSLNAGDLTLISNFSTLSLKNTSTVLRPDGNLVIYNRSTGQALWASRTSADCGKSECMAKFQTDGNLVIYRFGNPIWSTGTQGVRIEFSDYAPYLKIINVNGQVVYQ
jgi:outer membrane protein assembly factor BamB